MNTPLQVLGPKFSIFNQRTLFYLVLLINAILILTVKYYPSMDGPSHLYNSNLLKELILNPSSEIHNYFVINKFPVANWISIVILALFNSFLPAWIAEKILILSYLFGICLSFRFLIKQINPASIDLSFLIFPFAYSFLFYLGFYNSSISYIFIFYTVGYWIKHHKAKNYRHYFILFGLISLLYFSAILSFLFAGLIIGLIECAYFIEGNKNNSFRRVQFRKLFIDLLLLLLVSLPYLVLTYYFVKTTNFYPSGQQYSHTELIKWLNDVRCLIVYDYAGDEILTQQILHIIIAIVAISLYLRFTKAEKLKLHFNDIFLIPTMLTLILYLITPNGSGAGLMSDRYCLLVFMLFIPWVASQTLPFKVIRIFVFLILAFHLGLLFKHHNGAIRDLDKHAQTISNTQQYIDKNSIVFPVNFSDNWLEPHFSNYLGVDKPMIILENYEASVGWFPLQWKTSKMPNIKLDTIQEVNGIAWHSNKESAQIRQIDYVFLYGNLSKINNLEWNDLKTILSKSFELQYTSPDNYVQLYRKRD